MTEESLAFVVLAVWHTTWCSYFKYKGPSCYKKNILEPSPTWKLILGLTNSWIFRIFIQPQHCWGTFTCQKLWFFNKLFLTHATQRKLACLNKSQMDLIIAALLHSSHHFKPNPPSLLGQHTSFQETLALGTEFSAPFHKNLFRIFSIAFKTFFWEDEHTRPIDLNAE